MTSSGMSVGSSRVDITPPPGVDLCGYGFYLDRKAELGDDSLYATSLVIEEGNEKVALVGCDLIGLDNGIVREIRGKASAESGVPEENIMISCTHTHSSPATGRVRGCGEVNEKYISRLGPMIASGVTEASKSLENAEVRFAQGTLDDHTYNRTTYSNTVDPELSVISFGGPKGKLLVNFACHPVFLRGDNKIPSRDFVGYVVDNIEGSGFERVLYTNGCCGDVEPHGCRENGTDNFKQAERFGKTIAKRGLEILEDSEGIGDETLRCLSETTTIPYKIPQNVSELRKMTPPAEMETPAYAKFVEEWENAATQALKSGDFKEEAEAEIQAIALRDYCLICLPGEVFTDIGRRIKKKNEKVVVIGYANGCDIGYVPTRKDFFHEGYASTVAPMIYGLFPLKEDAGETMTEAADSLIKRIRNPQSP